MFPDPSAQAGFNIVGDVIDLSSNLPLEEPDPTAIRAGLRSARTVQEKERAALAAVAEYERYIECLKREVERHRNNAEWAREAAEAIIERLR